MPFSPKAPTVLCGRSLCSLCLCGENPLPITIFQQAIQGWADAARLMVNYSLAPACPHTRKVSNVAQSDHPVRGRLPYFIPHPSSLIPHPSSLIPHPSSLQMCYLPRLPYLQRSSDSILKSASPSEIKCIFAMLTISPIEAILLGSHPSHQSPIPEREVL
jgi:hypothetical protein